MIKSQYPEYITTEAEAQRFLQEFPNTEILSVVGLGITHLEWLLQLPHLHTLYIQGFYHSGNRPEQEDTVTNFSGIRHVTTLRNITIHDCHHFGDDAINILADAPHLTRISISSFMHTISNITPLSRVCSLEELDLSGYARQEHRYLITKMLLGTFTDSFEKQARIIHHSLPHCRILLRVPTGQHASYPSTFWGKTIPQR